MPHDYFNRGVVFSQANFVANKTSSVYPNAPAGTLYYGDPGVTRQFTNNSWGSSRRMSESRLIPSAMARRCFAQAALSCSTTPPSLPASATSRTRRLPPL